MFQNWKYHEELMLDTKPKDLGLIPGTHMVERENQLLKSVL